MKAGIIANVPADKAFGEAVIPATYV